MWKTVTFVGTLHCVVTTWGHLLGSGIVEIQSSGTLSNLEKIIPFTMVKTGLYLETLELVAME